MIWLLKSIYQVNWPLLLVVWWAAVGNWQLIFVLGLGWDLVVGQRLGISSGALLIVSLPIYLYGHRLAQFNWFSRGLLVGLSELVFCLMTGRTYQWQSAVILVTVAMMIGWWLSRRDPELGVEI